ncbi:MAG: hypothetical protein RID18_00175 [Cytophagales bacterium]
MDHFTTYFNGEKLQCIAGAVFSLIGIAASVYFLFLQKPVLKGLAYAIIPLSILLLIICIGVIVRTPKDLARLTTYQEENPKNIQIEEIPRMEKVMKSFGIVKKVELAFFLIGTVLTAIFWRNELIKGIGIGLIIMGVCLYAFDHIAESRGKMYVQLLKSL